MVREYSIRRPQNIAEINADPTILSGLHFKGGPMAFMDIKNAHIKNLVLENVDARASKFENITFENCIFDSVLLIHCEFKNVLFLNCTLKTSGAINDADFSNLTSFDFSKMENVVFKNSKLKKIWITSIKSENSYIYFIDSPYVTGIKENGGSFLSSSNAHIRIKNSNIIGSVSISGEKSSVVIFDSSIRGTYAAKDLYINNSTMSNSSIESSIMSVCNSTINFADFMINERAYLFKNIYNNYTQKKENDTNNAYYGQNKGSAVVGKKDAVTHVWGTDSKSLSALSLRGGNMFVSDMTLQSPTISDAYSQEKATGISSLNLRNVKILGGRSVIAHILSGQWENVSIEPEFAYADAHFTNIKAYNLTFPKGSPWVKAELNIFSQGTPHALTWDVTPSPTPFEWPEVNVPTLEELGIEWGNPDAIGYHPEKTQEQ